MALSRRNRPRTNSYELLIIVLTLHALLFSAFRITLNSLGIESTIGYSVGQEVLLYGLLLLALSRTTLAPSRTVFGMILIAFAYLMTSAILHFPTSVSGLRLFAYPLLAYLLGMQVRPYHVFRILRSLTTVFFVLNLLSLIGYLSHEYWYAFLFSRRAFSSPGIPYYYGLPRFLSVTLNPLAAGPLLVLFFNVSLGVLLTEERSSGGLRLMGLIENITFAVLVFLTLSRGAVLALSVSILSFVSFKRTRRMTISILLKACIFITVLIAILTTLSDEFRADLVTAMKHYSTLVGQIDFNDGFKNPVDQRIENWINGLEVFLANPMGYGVGSFSQPFGTTSPFQIQDMSYFVILNELNPIGLLIYLAALGVMFFRTLPPESHKNFGLAFATRATLLGFMVQAFGSSTLYQYPAMLLLGLFGGLSFSRGGGGAKCAR